MNKETLIVKQAYTGKVLETIPMSSSEDIDNMLDIANNLHKNSSLPAYQRIEILHKLSHLIENEKEDFAKLIANEGGKPLKDARVEVTRAIDGIGIAISELRCSKGEEIPMDMTKAGSSRLAFTTLEPIGVVVSVSAFNHPLNLIIHQVVPAIATGCPVIVKPAGTTPLNCIRFVQLCKKAGVPDGWVQVAITNTQNSQKLVTDKRVAFFSFIGSARVGWMLKSKLANGTRCALEHGGVAPLIFDKYKDIDKFVNGVIKAGFYHGGQVCVSVQRIYVTREKEKEISTLIANKAKNLIVGDAINEDTDVGPLISENEVTRVDKWVKEAINEGATLLTGGKIINNICYSPTVLLNPNENSKVSKEEVFAPVVCVYGYDDINEAIQRANGLEVSFQSSIFSDDIHTALKVARKLEASAVMVNDYTTFRVDWMPFAGRKSSGYGIGGIGHTMSDMQEHKMIVLGE
jgi:acyl-CoA reductase-like NAD-dependent aldehyde dehydrogenase